jgi:DNA polymerase-3 subunit beta
MKVVLNRSKFLEAFNLAASGASSQIKDVLGNVLIDATTGRLEASNGETSLAVDYTASHAEGSRPGGTALLDPRRVGSILKESRSELVTIEADEKSIEITTDEGSFTLQARNPSEFPRVSSIEGKSIEVGSTGLLGALRRVDFATDVDSTRYQLGGVNFVAGGDRLELIATDGRRMAYSALDLHLGSDLEGGSAIVPTKALGLVKRSLEGSEGFIGISVYKSSIQFRGDKVAIQTRLVEGRYPNWQSVIPAADGIDYRFLAGPFMQAVRQASVTAEQESRGVVFSFGDGYCKIAAKAADVGRSQVSVPLETPEAFEITMDYRFVLDWLQSLDKTDQVSLWCKKNEGWAKPTLWVSGESKYVIMPMERK